MQSYIWVSCNSQEVAAAFCTLDPDCQCDFSKYCGLRSGRSFRSSSLGISGRMSKCLWGLRRLDTHPPSLHECINYYISELTSPTSFQYFGIFTIPAFGDIWAAFRHDVKWGTIEATFSLVPISSLCHMYPNVSKCITFTGSNSLQQTFEMILETSQDWPCL